MHRESCLGHLGGLEEARMVQSLGLHNHGHFVSFHHLAGMREGPAPARSSPPFANPLDRFRYNLAGPDGVFHRNVTTECAEMR
jgi:hypothetical protein